MPDSGQKTVSSAALVPFPSDLDHQKGLDVELEQSGQTYFDKEEEGQLALVQQSNIGTNEKESDEEARFVLRNYLLCGFKWQQIKWSNVVWLVVLHTLFTWGYAHCLLRPVKLQSVIWTVLGSVFSGFGMSVGAHRLWAHCSFEAKPLLGLFLLMLQTMTINGSAFSYARDHRNHHKWPATDADPKNPARGFFFAHIGWWMLRKRPEVAKFGRKVPIDDLLQDRMLMLQHRFYLPLVILLGFVLPISVPVIVWHEQLFTSVALSIVARVVVLHHLFTVNSVAHFWGYRPYNRFQKPTENHLINWISMGEGSHNYHHTFPFDYCNSEYLWWEVFNPASLFIEVCILLGLASKPKKPSANLVRRVIELKGKPEYFAHLHGRSLPLRVGLAMLDWTLGLLFAQWPMWIVVLYKAALGLDMIVL